MTTKNEYIASIMLEAADLLKNDYESLTEGYTKDSYDLVKDDFRTIKNNMIKANNLRTQSKFNESEKLLNETLGIISNVKNKVKNMDDPKLLQRITSSIIGNTYINMKTKLQNTSSAYYPYGNGYAVSSITASPDAGLSGMKKVIDKYLNACIIDIKNMIVLCEKGYTKKLKSKTGVFIKERGSYNYRMLNKASKKQKKASKGALQEAIDLLYDKAMLCEDADEAEGYVQKAEELQKAIDDIPEETPVKQDDYETSAVGGDDEKPDLEEIKDLCDGDPEVVKLLTDDEDKSVTVDSDGETNTESYGWF